MRSKIAYQYIQIYLLEKLTIVGDKLVKNAACGIQ